jgi:hypothetical protein
VDDPADHGGRTNKGVTQNVYYAWRADRGLPQQPPDWQVIGLHHAGGEYVRKLNGHPGTYAANEAIWIQSIAKPMADSFTA